MGHCAYLHGILGASLVDCAPYKDKAAMLAGYVSLYPPMARQQLIEEFKLVLGVLSELEPAVLAERAKG